MAESIDEASIGPSKTTAIGLLTLTPATLGAGISELTLKPIPTVVKVEANGESRVPSVSTTRSPSLIV